MLCGNFIQEKIGDDNSENWLRTAYNACRTSRKMFQAVNQHGMAKGGCNKCQHKYKGPLAFNARSIHKNKCWYQYNRKNNQLIKHKERSIIFDNKLFGN